MSSATINTVANPKGTERFVTFMGRRCRMYNYEFTNEHGVLFHTVHPDLEECRAQRDWYFSFPLYDRYFKGGYVDRISGNAILVDTILKDTLKDMALGETRPYFDASTGHHWELKRVN